jgi:Family of unknown function (DUF6535)
VPVLTPVIRKGEFWNPDMYVSGFECPLLLSSFNIWHRGHHPPYSSAQHADAHAPNLNSSTSYLPTFKSDMSALMTEMDGDIPLEERKHQAAPIPLTRNRNKDTINPVMAEVRIDEGYIPGMVKESTVWDVYNNEARKVDNELVKDWTASLNFLLVFVSRSHLFVMVYLPL